MKRLFGLCSLIGIVAVLTVSSIGCASSQAVHVATTADTAITNALHQVYLDEQKTYASHLYSQAKHDSYLKTIRAADQDAIVLTDAIDQWRRAGADPKTVPGIVASTKAALQKVLDDLAQLPPDNALVKALQTVIKLLN